jgi:hypothetical protein
MPLVDDHMVGVDFEIHGYPRFSNHHFKWKTMNSRFFLIVSDPFRPLIATNILLYDSDPD